MIQQLYMCTNPNSPLLVQNCDQLEDYKTNIAVMPYIPLVLLYRHKLKRKKGSKSFLLVLIFCRIVLTKIVCIAIEETNMFVEQDMMQICTCGYIFFTTLSIPIVLANSFVFMLCRIDFKNNRC